jgi:SAM-dependent methyltransferase
MSRGQTWDPARYERHARFVSDLAEPVIALLAPAAGERVLDLGCGDGVLSARLVARGCRVVGVDASAAQVAAARARGIDAHVADGESLPFAGEFDAVFSNAALHWMQRPDAVLAGVHRALRPGGRFVGEFGGAGNVAAIEAALRAALTERGVDPQAIRPWYYPSDTEYAERLAANGFTVRSIALIPRPTRLPGDLRDWVETFAHAFLAPLPPADRPAFLTAVQTTLRPHLCDPDGHWSADYIRLRFAASRA